ncbi:MAG TPA: type II secretion system protein [Candidatus Dormibacteraeota bacterium]|jgi:prepilin-type N-terminal cleavage/methylation domain-containing protein
MFARWLRRRPAAEARVARVRRHTRVGERGLTLIEMVVTIAIVSVAVVGIAGGLAATERLAGITQDQSQLEVAMRQLSDFVRDSTPSSGLSYTPCAQPATYNSGLRAKPPGITGWRVVQVYESTNGTRNGVGQTNPLQTTPLRTCSGHCPGASCVGDWGVQEISLSVSNGARSLTRMVWKSNSW